MSLNKWLIGCACSSLLCLSAMSKCADQTKCVGDDCGVSDGQDLSAKKTSDVSSEESKEAVKVSKEADKKTADKKTQESEASIED